jgi:putative transposase
MTPVPQRKHLVHLAPLDSGNRPVVIFLTVCTRNRQPLLATARAHADIIEAWKQATHWLVGRYVIMPDHLHLFCSPGTVPAQPFNPWMRYWQNLRTL